ncbi:hypothetical protein EW026_g5334 [Hermanssonia centrifuga]|uniref:Jacalin-type lectin domain-containing protein n=1 Tax=Hermanssonia centrifuga TaxID=98765 RepID=A0A4S4KG62_9APHY|nr:hypothetical protein EW026_g5334 [Hermanssonia centrifuga]
MYGFTQTSLIGGKKDANFFNDIFMRDTNKNIHLNSTSNGGINYLVERQPIAKIKVSYGWIIDGIEVTYNVQTPSGSGVRDTTVTLTHGSHAEVGTNTLKSETVTVGTNETIIAVYGKAGRYTAGATDRDMVHTINFVILDRSTQQVRTVGPFGTSTGGSPYCCTDPCAFGGFATVDNTEGLCGLFFFKGTDLL